MRVMRLALRLVGILVIAALFLIRRRVPRVGVRRGDRARTYDAGGAPHATQVRGTDDDETMWIRAGRPGNAWYGRVLGNRNVEAAPVCETVPMLAARDASVA